MTEHQNPTLPERVERSPDVLLRELGGESVLLDLKEEQYYGLDEVGTRFWALLEEGKSMAEVTATLLEEYDVTEIALRRDLAALLDDLLEAGLVTVPGLGPGGA